MGKRGALAAGYATAFAGGLSPWAPPSLRPLPSAAAQWISIALVLLWVFIWLAADRTQHGHRRPRWLDIGIVLRAVVFVPVYLLRTRPRSQWLTSLGGSVVVLAG